MAFFSLRDPPGEVPISGLLGVAGIVDKTSDEAVIKI